jgi:hypothetical protein
MEKQKCDQHESFDEVIAPHRMTEIELEQRGNFQYTLSGSKKGYIEIMFGNYYS